MVHRSLRDSTPRAENGAQVSNAADTVRVGCRRPCVRVLTGAACGGGGGGGGGVGGGGGGSVVRSAVLRVECGGVCVEAQRRLQTQPRCSVRFSYIHVEVQVTAPCYVGVT